MSDHLRRCRCACFAKRAKWAIDSAISPREALSGADVWAQYAPLRLLRHPSGKRNQYSAPLARCGFSLRRASGALLNRLRVRGESDALLIEQVFDLLEETDGFAVDFFAV